MGLAISRELITLMNGTIELDSIEGVGTTMTIHVKLDKDTREHAGMAVDTKSVATLSSAAGSSEEERVRQVKQKREPTTVRILLAEDNELLRNLTVRILVNYKFQVVAVENGQQAVEELRKRKFDLILMDGQMPVKDGYSATKEIRNDPDSAIASIPIIALTASAFQGDQQRCFAAGMSHYISKPVRARDLERAIWEQLVD